MADMQDTEQQVYLELVQELLSCPQGEEQALLATRPELVNEQLVAAMLAVAQWMQEQDGEESNAGWLQNFARQVAQQIGLELDSDDEDCGQEDLDFLNALIQAEMEDSSQVQQLFAQNLQRLTPGLGAIMKWLVTQVVATQPEEAESFVGLIENVVIRLSEFLLGNRAQNMEIVIAGYEVVLTVRT